MGKSKFFNETMQGLLEAIAIKNDEIKVIEVPNMAAKTLRSKEGDLYVKTNNFTNSGTIRYSS